MTTNTSASPTVRDLSVFESDFAKTFKAFDIYTVGGVLLLAVGILLIHDVLVYLLASTSSRKRLLVTPWLTQIIADSWEELNQHGAYARSDSEVGSILNSLADTARKYEGRWEKSRML